MMDFTKATDNQLWTIISDDWNVPKEYLRPLVDEAFSRNLFNGLIKHLAKTLFGRLSYEYRKNFQDLYSIACIGISKALKNYIEGKSSFSSFAFRNIESELIKHRQNINAQKREHYKDMQYLDSESDVRESLLNTLIDHMQNPERTAIKRIFWSDLFENLSEVDRKVLVYFGEGYSMKEIGGMLGHSSSNGARKRFHRTIKKLNPNAEINLMTSGLSIKPRKGALA